jgi:glyoxylase I family protein
MRRRWFGAVPIGLRNADAPRVAHARPAVAGGANVDQVTLAPGPFEPAALRAHLAAHDVEIAPGIVQGRARGWGHSVRIRDARGNRLALKGPDRH